MPKVTKKLLLGLVVISIIFVAIVVSIYSKPPEQINTPTRESVIPKDAVKMTPEMDVFPPIFHSDEWMEPVPLPQSINTAGGEDSPFIMPDGNTLYFFFTPNVSVPAEKQLLDKVTGIYVSKNRKAYGATQKE